MSQQNYHMYTHSQSKQVLPSFQQIQNPQAPYQKQVEINHIKTPIPTVTAYEDYFTLADKERAQCLQTLASQQNLKEKSLEGDSPYSKYSKFRLDQPSQQEDEEGQGNCYRDLTSKLQTALKKISNSKKQFSKLSNKSFDTMSRFEDLQKRKKRAVQQKREQLKRLEQKQLIFRVKQMKSKPTINKNSQKISKDCGYEPIHKRFEKIVEQKMKKYVQNQQLKKKIMEQQEQRFMEQFQKHFKKPQNMRSYDTYYQQMLKWKAKTQQQIKLMAQQRQKKQLQQATFHPQLNPKSIKIVEKIVRGPIQERGLIKKKKVAEYPFAPRIHRRRNQN